MPEHTIPVVFESTIKSLPLLSRGKVRDIYSVDDDLMLIITTDRLSAFDVVLPTPIPGKGAVLTALSAFWFARTEQIIANHLTGRSPEEVLADDDERAQARGRGIVVRTLKPLPVEAIVRGYLIGSGWKDYQQTGAVCGLTLPANLKLADQLPEPIFTPSTKAALGAHDENIDFNAATELLGETVAHKVRALSLEIYKTAAEYARGRGIIIADTKFEFGLDPDGKLVLIDEVLTPDSSRFWPAATWQPGNNPSSFDKQYVRDYLETLNWDKRPPGPGLPDDVIRQTAEKYHEALDRLTS